MLVLSSTSDLLRVVTTTTADIEVHASWVDLSGSTTTPGRTNTAAITSATTTTVVASPASSTYRNVKTLTVTNVHASTSNTVSVILTDGSIVSDLIKTIALPAGYSLQYNEGAGFGVYDTNGRIMQNVSTTSTPTVNTLNTVVLSSDVTNNNGTANTIQDVTGLSFAVTAGQTYWFRVVCDYTAAATATGSRWSINGPGSPTRLAYFSQYSLTTTSVTTNTGLTAYDLPAASNATSAATAGNVAIVEGYITPSSNGTVIVRHASEVLSSAITAKAGSTLQWMRVL